MLSKEAGFDPRRDLKTAVVFVPHSLLEGKGEDFLLVGEGRFNEKRIVAFLKKEGAKMKRQRYGGHTLYILDNEGALVFDGRFALLGTIAQVKGGLTNKSAGGGYNSTLARLVAPRPEVSGGVRLPAKLRKKMGKDVPPAADLEAGAASVKLGRMLGVEIRLFMTNGKSASMMQALLTNVVQEMGKQPDIKKLGLDKAVARMQIKHQGKLVVVKTTVAASKIGKLVRMLVKEL